MSELDVFFRVWFLGVSLLLLSLGIISYLRVRNIKLLFVGCAFGVFTIKGLLLVAGIFYPKIEGGFGVTTESLLLDFAIIGLLYVATVKRVSESNKG